MGKWHFFIVALLISCSAPRVALGEDYKIFSVENSKQNPKIILDGQQKTFRPQPITDQKCIKFMKLQPTFQRWESSCSSNWLYGDPYQDELSTSIQTLNDPLILKTIMDSKISISPHSKVKIFEFPFGFESQYYGYLTIFLSKGSLEIESKGQGSQLQLITPFGVHSSRGKFSISVQKRSTHIHQQLGAGYSRNEFTERRLLPKDKIVLTHGYPDFYLNKPSQKNLFSVIQESEYQFSEENFDLNKLQNRQPMIYGEKDMTVTTSTYWLLMSLTSIFGLFLLMVQGRHILTGGRKIHP